MTNEVPTFSSFGRSYQEKVVQALLQDHQYAEQMADVLEPSYFTLGFLESISRTFFSYKSRYATFPSLDLIMTMLKDEGSTDDPTMAQIVEFAGRVIEQPLNGDIKWIRESSLEFCRRQAVIAAIKQTLDKVEEKNYDAITKIMRDALERGAPRDIGHEYADGFKDRIKKTVRQPIPTGWEPIDKALNGGLERGTLSTIIAPTGAGKSMFLTNIACAGIENGYDVLYCTLEMADYKIGLRADSYFSGVSINDLPNHEEKVVAAQKKAKGKLIIKEWPTKQASVQTIRTHLQRLETVKSFKPTVVLVDYADLLKGTRYGNGEKRYELEAIYEELRALAQEFNIAVVTADQTNRGGLDKEIVTLESIAEAYSKATVCDVIITISRRLEDKQRHTGRMFIAKSRLGPDGMVYNFIFNPSTVKAHILKLGEDPMESILEDKRIAQKTVADAYSKLRGKKAQA